MKLIKLHIAFALLFLGSTLSYGGEKSVRLGAGYSSFKFPSHGTFLHSGRYFYGGFSNQFGSRQQHYFNFQLSNSNRELTLDLPYVSAATDLNINYAYLFNIHIGKKTAHEIGPMFSSNTFLNFFPSVDANNFLWQVQNSVGLRGQHSFKIKGNKSLELNYDLPLYSCLTFNKMDRFSGDIPGGRPNVTYAGFANRIFNAQVESGLTFNYMGIKWGTFYLFEYNSFGETAGDKVINTAHSINLRIIY